MLNSLLIASLISVVSPTEANLPTKVEIDAINKKALHAVELMKQNTEQCGDPFVTNQIVGGVSAPEGSKLCQDMVSRKFKLIFPTPTLVYGEFRNDYVLSN
ncbi:hypothetical protein H5185_12440 [Shewanella sp. SG44-6]|jgi:hypothetical protein|uniref:hypothetical protein n=1 Tax=Shewanella sp. SG44-6 TaxID=2760959 RepID=UPI001602F455|nr:hypothetical protein [Shewanella sp. SG44-6]MBB1390223.1 hypothetical protein [Shewanella sp. SG44-6]